jgi:hypothetical protein
MKSDFAASTLMSALLWSMLLLSLFAAPALMAARGGDTEIDGHTADLIRQHQEAVSPFPKAPEAERQIQAGACGQTDDLVTGGAESARGAGPDDAPMIRPVGHRAKRIQV